MKNEILERMNEKRNHLYIIRTLFRALKQLSGLFHNFVPSFPYEK